MVQLDMGTIIEARGVVKTYPVRSKKKGLLGTSFFSPILQAVALDRVTFQIDQGSFVGLIGANGAGKSTLIKLLTGILTPSSGEIRVFGQDPTKERRQNAYRFGLVMGQRSQLWWDLPARDSFEVYRRMYGVSSTQFKQSMEIYDELLELHAFIDKPVRQLSLGQRMRCELAVTLLHRPAVLFLDEPTIGIDLLAKERIMEFIRQINREYSTTVLLTTHDVGDMEQLAECVLILDQGKLIHNGPMELLKQVETLRRIDVQFFTAVEDLEFPGVRVVQRAPNRVTLLFERDQVSVTQLLGDMITHYPVADVAVQAPDIETVVRRVYQNRTTGLGGRL
jgi:ABC-2 type transport system ATP-binding protein